MELIGVLRWAVEIGRVGILYETSIMSTHLALPRVEHLEQLFHVFGYLKEKPKQRIDFDPDHPFIDEWWFKKHDCFAGGVRIFKAMRGNTVSSLYIMK